MEGEGNRGNRCRAVLFDLDGTLLDTLDDLTASANAMLGRYGLAPRTREEIRQLVGNGIRRLIVRLLPLGEADPLFEEAYEWFCGHYGAHCMDRTSPYPGVVSLLSRLKEAGVRTGVVSNKGDFAVQKLMNRYFPGLVDVAFGEREGIRRKPAPDMLLRALEILGVAADEAVYVGDSEVDIQTARNAGIRQILVTWGFRDADFLQEQGAMQMASDSDGLFALLGE